MTDTSPDSTLRSNLRSMTTDITLSPFFRDIARQALAQIEAHDAEIASWQEHAAGNGKEADEIYAELVEARRQRDEARARVGDMQEAMAVSAECVAAMMQECARYRDEALAKQENPNHD